MRRRDILRILPLGTLGLTSASAVGGWLLRAKTEGVDPETDGEHNLWALADIIIPETDTPGAISAGVPQFILFSVDHLTAEDSEAFREQLSLFTTRSAEFLGGHFHKMDEESQRAFVAGLAFAGDPFYLEVRHWTIKAYFTSQEGITEALYYNPTPGKYDPCVEVTDSTRAAAPYF